MPSLGAGTPMRAQRKVTANLDAESSGRGSTRQGEEGEAGRMGDVGRMSDAEKEKHKEKGGTESSFRRRG